MYKTFLNLYSQKLDSHKAMGIDSIPTRFIKAHLLVWQHFLCSLLIRVFLLLFSQLAGKLPYTYFEIKNLSLSNFRPISVLSVFSKILERVISDQIVGYFHRHNFFLRRSLVFVMDTPLRMSFYMLSILGIKLLIVASMLVLCS